MIINERLETAVTKRCEVLVVGGGIAGISAALAAARLGKRVILAEREYILGGLGTAGLVTIFLPLCDGMGHQVSFGIAEELLRLSVSLGAEAMYPENWLGRRDCEKRAVKDGRFQVRYNAQLFAILAEQLLLREGVELLYGSYAVRTITEDGKISAVIIENKSGRQAIAAKAVVDATGDCDIAHFSGASTSVFGQGNVLAAWYYYTDGNTFDLKPLGCSDIPDSQKAEGASVETLINRRFTGLDGDEIPKAVQLSHNEILKDILTCRKNGSDIVPTTIATVPQMRMTRRLNGEYTLCDTEQHKYFENSVGMVSDWRKPGPVYEIPFDTLYSKRIKNLITAGRCISVTDAMWDIMRVIPCCAVTGQAAGTAAGLSDDFSALDVSELQKALREQSVVLHEKDLKG